MLYIAVGDSEDWKEYSKPKPVRWDISSIGKTIRFGIEDPEWQVERSCTLTHWYLLDEAKRTVLRKHRLGRAVCVNSGDTLTLTDVGLEIYEDDSDDKSEPYLR